MAIYRGPGGSGDAVNDASSETRLAVEARDAALAAQAAAEAAQVAAELAETNAETAETNAETSETNAANSATSASSSASAASSSASSASTSATNAASSASSASTSATNAASSASSASTSASSASTSATNAASSASTASTQATNASNSASAAATSASQASTSASNAATSATLASGYATNASNSASVASTKATESSTYATNSANSATASANSASASALSASDSNTAKLAAQAASSNATTQASNASISAASASSAQVAAEAARDATLAAYDNFDDRYLGTKSSDPTLDNDGNALVAGALYFNTVSNGMKVYTGSAWVAAYISAAGVLMAANNLSDLPSVSTARTNLGLGTAATTASTDYATAAQGATADSAYADRLKWDGGATGLVAATGRTSLGVTATGSDTTYAYRANNLSDLANASTARTNLGLGTIATQNSNSVTITGGSITGITDLAVADGGTGLSSLTAGYIPFGAGTSAFGSSVNLFWDSVNARLGIGTSSPVAKINSSAADGTYQLGLSGTTKGIRVATNSTTSQITGVDNTLSTSYQPLQIGGSILTFAYSGTTEGMRLDGSGNLGIGTSSPNILTWNKALTLNTATGNTAYELGIGGVAQAYFAADSTNVYLAAYANKPLLIRTNNSTVATFDTSGNLGLGVTPSAWSASYKALEINGISLMGSTVTNDFMSLGVNFYFNGTNWIYKSSEYATRYYQVDGTHSWYTAPSGTAGNAITFTQAMTLNASGNLGVGTTSPAYRLTVDGGYVALRSGNGVTFLNPSNNSTSDITNGAASGSSDLRFGVAGSERMRIDSSGNLLVGGTSSYNKLTVTASSGDGIRIKATGSAALIMDGSSSNDLIGLQNVPMTFQTNNTERFRIGASGQLGIGGANYGTSGQALVSNGSGSAPSWQTVSGGQYFGTATTKAIAYNSNTISENITVTAGNNGLSAGPVTVSTGYTVTVETGANWVIV